MIKKATFFIVTFILLNELAAQTIPSARIVNWKNVGYPGTLPAYANIVQITSFGGIGDGITINNTALQNAIGSLNGNAGVIYFRPGVFKFSSTVALTDSVIIRGAASDSTTLLFDLNGTLNNCFNVHGTEGTQVYTAVTSCLKDSNKITFNQTSGLQAGDHLRLYQNDSSLVVSSWAYGSVGQIVKIQSITGSQVTIAGAFRKDYLISDNCKAVKLDPIKEVGFECVKIKRADATANQTQNIDFDRAVNCWVKGIESDTCNFAHVALSYSSNILVTESYFHHAFAYGGSGQGYGVVAQYTSGECLITNNIFMHLRHSMIIQAGANGNVYSYNYSFDPYWTQSPFPTNSAGEIVLHGNYPFCNLFEGNIVQNMVIDDSHGMNGPFNTLFRNRGEFYGILMNNNPASNNQNFVGNEVTNSAQGFYLLYGTGHFQYGNNVKGTVTPAGTANLPDSSYYLSTKPPFFPIGNTWPSIGFPDTLNSGTIPARSNQMNGQLTSCSGVVITTGMNSSEIFDRIKVMPNPAMRHIIFNFKNNGYAQVEIYTVTGEIILSGKIMDTEKLDISDLSKGIYYIKIYIPGQPTEVKKICIIPE